MKIETKYLKSDEENAKAYKEGSAGRYKQTKKTTYQKKNKIKKINKKVNKRTATKKKNQLHVKTNQLNDFPSNWCIFLCTDICQPGWTYFGVYCYFTSPACASWLTAESNCSAMNSDLVTIHNQEENVFIQHRHDGDKSWIGLNDRNVEGSFVWTNKEISSFRFWAPKQPNDWNNEDCVHTLGAKHGYTWNDVPCNNCFNFTCFTGDDSIVDL